MSLFETTSSGEVPVEIGDVLARKYRVERVLGVGGMGVVVAARHIDLNELRALKFLLPAARDCDETVQRFLREARAVVRLKSEHVVKVFDVGRFDTGEPYIVMEYLEGEDLKSLIEKRAQVLPVSDCVDIILQSLEAMAEAHAAGIVHRDLKPANLYLTTDRDGGVCVKVLDFGISKLLDTSEEDGMDMTTTHALMGSPYYMSPEQMMSTRDVDARTDIWSIGVVLYQMITGRVPFRGRNIAAQCALLLQKSPEPPSSRTGRPLPPGFDEAMLSFLRREPEDRYQTTATAAEALVPFGGPLARRSLARIQRALAGSVIERSGDDHRRLPQPSHPSLTAAIGEADGDDQAQTRSRPGAPDTLPWGAAGGIAHEPTVERGMALTKMAETTGPKLSLQDELRGDTMTGGPDSSSAAVTPRIGPDTTGPQRPVAAAGIETMRSVDGGYGAATGDMSALEAPANEAMSQSTKASWQTAPPTNKSRSAVGLWLGGGAALLVGAVAAFALTGGNHEPPASQAAPPMTEPAPTVTAEPDTPDEGARESDESTPDPKPVFEEETVAKQADADESAAPAGTPPATVAPPRPHVAAPPRPQPAKRPDPVVAQPPKPQRVDTKPPKDPFGEGRH